MKLHFGRSIRGLQNFLVIPIMNPLAGFMISLKLLLFCLLCSGDYFYMYIGSGVKTNPKI